jgi:hypothetical protein
VESEKVKDEEVQWNRPENRGGKDTYHAYRCMWTLNVKVYTLEIKMEFCRPLIVVHVGSYKVEEHNPPPPSVSVSLSCYLQGSPILMGQFLLFHLNYPKVP